MSYYSGRYKSNYKDRRSYGKSNKWSKEKDDNEGSSQSKEEETLQYRPPPGLRGREIGMWYAQRSIRRGKQHERDRITYLHLSAEKRSLLQTLVNRIDGCTSTKHEPLKSYPRRSFMDDYHQNVSANINAGVENVAKSSNPNISQGKSLVLGELRTDLDVSDYSMLRNSVADETLKNSFISQRETNEDYLRMLPIRQKLPAHEKQKELMELINSHQVVVISGETGCGKTTQVPQFILDEALEWGDGSVTKIVCTQPRRISAITVAERVAEERGERCGERNSSVGYQIRLEKKLPRQAGGTILYCTTGVVLEWMSGGTSSKSLFGVSHLILDEVHERDIHTDFLMTIVKETLRMRPDFRLILMSATINAEAFSKYFDAPSINIPGFTFPVQEFYLEDVLEATGFQIPPIPHKGYIKRSVHRAHQIFIEPFLLDMKASGKYSQRTIDSLALPCSEIINLELIATLVHHIHKSEKEGAILIFVPGWAEISTLNKLLTVDSKLKFLDQNSIHIHPLHSLMPTVNQKAVFLRPPKGIRKIIIATNIAETSITIDDVVYVIDAGKIKMTNYDAKTNISTLEAEWVSMANSHQRRGRAGRVQNGLCYHLFTRAREKTLEQYVIPEMLRTRLEEVVLKIKVLELGKVVPFLKKVMNPPDEKAVRRAVDMLVSICALDVGDLSTSGIGTSSREILTPLGFHLAKLPMDPQTGKMILFGAIFSCLDPILSVAASLSFKDAFYIPLGSEKLADAKRVELSRNTQSDHLMLANAFAGWEQAVENNEGYQYCQNNFLWEGTLRLLQKMKEQFAEHLYNSKFISSIDVKSLDSNRNSNNEGLVRSIICAGLYPNVAHVAQFLLRNGRSKVKISTASEHKVNIHLKSVNASQTEYKYRWLVYHKKLKTKAINLLDCSMVSPLSLIFNAKDMAVTWEAQSVKIIVDSFAKFDCEIMTGKMIFQLRKYLEELMSTKISCPGVSNWDNESREGAIIGAIVKLLGSEVIETDAKDTIKDKYSGVTETIAQDAIKTECMIQDCLNYD